MGLVSGYCRHRDGSAVTSAHTLKFWVGGTLVKSLNTAVDGYFAATLPANTYTITCIGPAHAEASVTSPAPLRVPPSAIVVTIIGPDPCLTDVVDPLASGDPGCCYDPMDFIGRTFDELEDIEAALKADKLVTVKVHAHSFTKGCGGVGRWAGNLAEPDMELDVEDRMRLGCWIGIAVFFKSGTQPDYNPLASFGVQRFTP